MNARRRPPDRRHSRTPPRRGPGRRRRGVLRRLAPLVALIAVAWLGWAAVGLVSGDAPDCDPFCGIAPEPPLPPADSSFTDASGWRLPYSSAVWGTPSVEERDRIEWRYGGGIEFGFRGTARDESASQACARERAGRADGFSLVYEIPFASIGDAPGEGMVLQRIKAPSGKPLKAQRFFLLCVRAGDVGLVAWARGPQERDDDAWPHADPAQSDAADYLAQLAAGVEFVDGTGSVLRGP